MGGRTVFRSMDQFERTYFPRSYEQKRIDKMSPEELGKYWAQQTIDEIKKLL